MRRGQSVRKYVEFLVIRRACLQQVASEERHRPTVLEVANSGNEIQVPVTVVLDDLIEALDAKDVTVGDKALWEKGDRSICWLSVEDKKIDLSPFPAFPRDSSATVCSSYRGSLPDRPWLRGIG